MEKSAIYDSTYKDQKAIAVESKALCFKFLPEFGSNLCSAVCKSTGREFMVQRPENEYRIVPFGGVYVDGECCGMDDMFPTIDSCHYEKEPWKGAFLVDHGEIWNLKADVTTEEDRVIFHFYGIRIPYILRKTVYFIAETVLRIDYELINRTQFDMEFLWAAHTMLKAEPGVKIFVPEELKRAVAVFSNTSRIGRYGEYFDWPTYIDSAGVKRRIDVMGEWENNCEKYYFAERLRQGWCAMQYPDHSVFALSFPAAQIPYLGILHNTGGFRNMYNLFLEPCSAPFDRPDFAAARGQGSIVKARSNYKWFINISISNKEFFKSVNEKGIIQ